MSFSNRLDLLKNNFHLNSLDGIYVTNLTNIRYLTGFTGSAGSLLILDNKQYFFTDGRYIEQSKNQVKNATIIITGSAHYSEIKSKNLLNDNMTIGFESDYVSVNLFSKFKQQINKIKWVSTSGIIEKIAAVKDKLEIESLQTAIDITDEVFLQIIPDLKEGAVEKEIAAKISYLFKMNGACLLYTSPSPRD